MNMNPGKEEVKSYNTPELATQKKKPQMNFQGVDRPLADINNVSIEEKPKGTRKSSKGPRTTQKKLTVSFNLDKCVLKAVENYCIDEDMTKSRFVNEALKQYAEKLGIEIDFEQYKQRNPKK
jgi:hypothetical protein